MFRPPSTFPCGLLLCSLLVLAGCGAISDEQAKDPIQAVPVSSRDQVAAAKRVDAAKFPKPRAGQSLQDFGARFDQRSGPQAISAISVSRPPEGRIAFGLLDAEQQFNYGPTVIYLQRRGSEEVVGPIAAPADVLITEPRFRSEQAATERDPFAAIYSADRVPLPEPGIYYLLVVSDIDGKRTASGMAVQVVSEAADRVPDVGEKAPAVQTDTRGSVKGNVTLLDTRMPPAPELAEKSFADVVGEKPVALLFASPQLCRSRVCGPVADEMLQMKAKYGDKMTFIHQEAYVENDLSQGFRPSLTRFALPSEPWLFTVHKDGKIAARLEGSIGIEAFESAVKAALHP